MTSSAIHLELPQQPPLVALLDRVFAHQNGLRLARSGKDGIDRRHFESALYGPLRGFLARPGKEFRSRLVDLCWMLCGGHGSCLEQLGSIVETLHAGSLIVDDIEDASATRRGQPALHIRYGLPIALNAGNWMYFWAYEQLEALDVGPHVKLGLYRWLSRTMASCHEGQALDLTVTMGHLDQVEVARLVETTTRLKTGALMGLAAVMPAVSLGLSHDSACAFQRFGESLGVGLQMLDDLGGLMSERRCHKGHEDLIHGRPTWPWAWLAELLGKGDYKRLQHEARAVEARDLHPELLAAQLRELLGPNAKRRVWTHLVDSLKHLPRQLPGSRNVSELQLELERLMRSYD